MEKRWEIREPEAAGTQPGNDERKRLRKSAAQRRSCSQALSELRRMIDRSSQPRWPAFILAWQDACQLEIAAKAHLKICQDNWTDVRRTRALGAWLLLLTGGGLRCRRAITLNQANNCIGDQIAREQQQGKERENAQKSVASRKLHQCRRDTRSQRQVNRCARAHVRREGKMLPRRAS